MYYVLFIENYYNRGVIMTGNVNIAAAMGRQDLYNLYDDKKPNKKIFPTIAIVKGNMEILKEKYHPELINIAKELIKPGKDDPVSKEEQQKIDNIVAYLQSKKDKSLQKLLDLFQKIITYKFLSLEEKALKHKQNKLDQSTDKLIQDLADKKVEKNTQKENETDVKNNKQQEILDLIKRKEQEAPDTEQKPVTQDKKEEEPNLPVVLRPVEPEKEEPKPADQVPVESKKEEQKKELFPGLNQWIENEEKPRMAEPAEEKPNQAESNLILEQEKLLKAAQEENKKNLAVPNKEQDVPAAHPKPVVNDKADPKKNEEAKPVVPQQKAPEEPKKEEQKPVLPANEEINYSPEDIVTAAELGMSVAEYLDLKKGELEAELFDEQPAKPAAKPALKNEIVDAQDDDKVIEEILAKSKKEYEQQKNLKKVPDEAELLKFAIEASKKTEEERQIEKEKKKKEEEDNIAKAIELSKESESIFKRIVKTIFSPFVAVGNFIANIFYKIFGKKENNEVKEEEEKV